MRRVIITCNNYYATDNHFIKGSILKPIANLKSQGPKILWVNKKKQF